MKTYADRRAKQNDASQQLLIKYRDQLIKEENSARDELKEDANENTKTLLYIQEELLSNRAHNTCL